MSSRARLVGINESGRMGQSPLFPDIEAEQKAMSGLLTDRFVVPPFSVLDSRSGYWQERKAQWLALGIQSELGRGVSDDVVTSGTGNHARYKRSNLNGESDLPEWAHNQTAQMAPGTSIFDPVLCEIAYRWFCTPGGSVLDPFAGGSVRGVIASMLGHSYTGIDLSVKQVEANRAQAATILTDDDLVPVWMQGDSAHMNRLLTEQYDLLFSCPPYYDLEIYGDAPGELSAMQTYEDFLRAYRVIIGVAADHLRPDRFAVWVVGEVRGSDGFQHGLVADTVKAFMDAGLRLHNEAVLLTRSGTLALRAPLPFISSRALGRSHQSVLVFWKGAKRPAWKTLDSVEEA